MVNKQNVICAIMNNAPIYRTEIARMTDLSIPTVMKITNEFINKGLVKETGKGESNGGKPPLLLQCVNDAYYIIGVDVGTTNINTIMMDLAAHIHYQCTIPTDSKRQPKIVLNQIIDSIEQVTRQSGLDSNRMLGIGIGIAGLLNQNRTGVVFSPDFGWEDVEIIESIKTHFHLPVYMDNVTRAMAMGERWFGLGRDREHFLCINLGYGIGAALFINGDLYCGDSGSSGEFGHMNMEMNGPLCACGNYGCLEALASANAMVNKAKFYIEKGVTTQIIDTVNHDISLINAKIIFDAAKQGDQLAHEIINDAIHYLGTAIASMINIFDPGLIILEGGVSQAGDILTQNIQRVVEQKRMRHAGNSTKVVASTSKQIASVGAASYLLKGLVENGGDINRLYSKYC